jgi:hypothetical protein
MSLSELWAVGDEEIVLITVTLVRVGQDVQLF